MNNFICRNGAIRRDKMHHGSALYNHPEKHCCSCGKSHNETALLTIYRIADNQCRLPKTVAKSVCQKWNKCSGVVCEPARWEAKKVGKYCAQNWHADWASRTTGKTVVECKAMCEANPACKAITHAIDTCVQCTSIVFASSTSWVSYKLGAPSPGCLARSGISERSHPQWSGFKKVRKKEQSKNAADFCPFAS